MVDRYAAVVDLRLLRSLAGAMIPMVFGLVVLAAVIGSDHGSPGIGSVSVAVVGIGSLGAVAWIRQFPVRPDDEASYGKAVMIKLGVAEVPGLIGFALGVALGPWWLAGIGASFSLVALALGWPSEPDRERHELLFLV